MVNSPDIIVGLEESAKQDDVVLVELAKRRRKEAEGLEVGLDKRTSNHHSSIFIMDYHLKAKLGSG